MPTYSLQAAAWIPWLPMIGAVVVLLMSLSTTARSKAAIVCITSVIAALFVVVGISAAVPDWDPTNASQHVVNFGEWIAVGNFSADWSYFVDPLTLIMLFVVTGIGSLIAIYAGNYMKGDRGFPRFFGAMALFFFAMLTLVLGGNLLVTFLGWEGVGLASYLLIGHDYYKAEARRAAIKAFVVNRIGDAGFLLGIFCIYRAFGSIAYADFLPAAQAMLDSNLASQLQGSALDAYNQAISTPIQYLAVAPYLILLGAFGKSAQFPLYTWLPDAMAGPTPVSALIHAATMVTAGVYLLARLTPLYHLSEDALVLAAILAAGTSLITALIALQQTDLKKIFAYSTVSQLGFMFLGVAALAPAAGVFHLVTHAFFKALLFLTAGNVMHALAGNLDIRTISGLGKKMPWTKWLMFAGCLALGAIPVTAGFISKETIIVAMFDYGSVHGSHGTLFTILGVVALIIAFLTCSYAFRAWFRVFTGPESYEMGDDHHGDDDDHHEPHEDWFSLFTEWPTFMPLCLLAVGAIFGGLLFQGGSGWLAQVPDLVGTSTAGVTSGGVNAAIAHADEAHGGAHGDGHGLHQTLLIVSIVISITAFLLAMFLHGSATGARDKLAEAFAPMLEPARQCFWVDDIYNAVFVQPLRAASEGLKVVDAGMRGLTRCVAAIPEFLGTVLLRPLQSGRLQGYALGMAGGLAVVAVLVMVLLSRGA